MLYDRNFTYDSSMPVYENKPPSFPYTLDYKLFHDCMIPPCPKKSFPGVWEVPMVMWQDLKGGRCSMVDGCSAPADAEGIYKMLIKNFERHYTTNRSAAAVTINFKLFVHLLALGKNDNILSVQITHLCKGQPSLVQPFSHVLHSENFFTFFLTHS
jgi:hypothetical protein